MQNAIRQALMSLKGEKRRSENTTEKKRENQIKIKIYMNNKKETSRKIEFFFFFSLVNERKFITLILLLI